MTIQQLEYIVALDTHRHFVKAADSCFVTQPTITLQIKKLEDEMGFLIFNREKQPLTPTAFGTQIIAQARVILTEIEALKQLINHEIEEVKGVYKLGVIPTISPYIIPQFAGLFSKSYEDVHLEIEEMQTDAIIHNLKTGRIDIGLLVTPLDEPTLIEKNLYKESFVAYGLRNNSDNNLIIKTEDVENMEGLWLLNSGHCFRNQVLNICNASEKKGNISFNSGSIETLKRMVDNYGGFTLLPELSIAEHDKNKISYFITPAPTRQVSLAMHKSFAKKALIEAISTHILRIIPENIHRNYKSRSIPWRMR